MAQAPYNVERTRVEVALCVAAAAVLLYKLVRLPTGDGTAPNVRAVLSYNQMVACQRAARWFGERAIRAELAYRKVV